MLHEVAPVALVLNENFPEPSINAIIVSIDLPVLFGLIERSCQLFQYEECTNYGNENSKETKYVIGL